MKSHELAEKLLKMPNMEVSIPMTIPTYDYSSPIETLTVATTGVKGSSDNPFKEVLILKGKTFKGGGL